MVGCRNMLVPALIIELFLLSCLVFQGDPGFENSLALLLYLPFNVIYVNYFIYIGGIGVQITSFPIL